MENKKPTTDTGKSVGDIIKERRLSAGISIDQLSLETKLKQDVIAAIEKGDYMKLPPFPYIRAFLITLCKHLKLNEKDLIENLYREMGLDNKKTESFEPEPITPSSTLSKGCNYVVCCCRFVGVLEAEKVKARSSCMSKSS